MSGIRSLLRGRRRIGVIATGAALVVGVGVAVTVPAYAAAGCRVVYSAPSQWPGGFTANVSITNLGDPINGWNLTWTFPSGQSVTQAWNATVAPPSGTVTATNASYNASIPTNGTVSFGFNGSWSGANNPPTSFTLNGTVCTGTVGPTTAGPTTPTTRSTTPPTTRSTTPPTTRPTTPPTSQPPGNAMAAVAAMQPGWNLGNSFDAVGADETAWGNPRVTQALINQVKAQGFKSIRIPVTWSNHHGSAPNYTIDAAWLNRVKEVVDWALAADLYVMINIHHDSWQWINNMQGDRTGVLNRFNALWTQIAASFRNHSAKLTFESVNEPQFSSGSDAEKITMVNDLNASFRSIVRASGGPNATRLLVMPTLNTSADQAKVDGLASAMASYNDPNLIATVHYYGYWPFSVNIAGTTTFDATTQADLVGYFDRVYNAFVSRNVPVILGEWGLLGFDRNTGTIQQGEKLKFFEYLGYYAKERRITTQLWDNGQHLGRTSLQWADPELINMMKASWTTRSATAFRDHIFVPRTGTITAKSLTLNLNGTSFVGLSQNGTDLVRNTDYTVSGDQLTLTAATVTRLVGNRAYGVNATLQARFSAGVPWRINIISNDPPILSNATGTTGSFNIPTQFRGDQLATMEAVYVSGGNAGPQNWTSFKEFDYTFTPNPGSNTITLKPEFFNDVNPGSPVTLTFHFWSGARVTYTVTESTSGSVTGTA